MSHSVSEDDRELTLLVAADDADDETMGGLFKSEDRELALRQIPVAILRRNLKSAVAGLRELFDEIAEEGGTLSLSEAHVNIEVSAKGGIQIVATAEASAKGAITLIFRS